jgi:hypothetical protein
MSKFEVGDRIRKTRGGGNIHTGDVATVVYVSDDGAEVAHLWMDDPRGKNPSTAPDGARYHWWGIDETEWEKLDKHAGDIAAIASALAAEARSLDLWDEYAAFVERLNEALHVKMPAVAQKYSVLIGATDTVSVMATSQDEANRKVAEAARKGL